MAYTAEQLKQLWIQAGGNPQNAAIAAAVALAESGGNASAGPKNNNGSVDRGLWQINSIHGALSSFDPLQNAKAAVRISNNGANWRPWCVAYTDKACGTKGGKFDPFSPLSGVSKFIGQAGVNGPPTNVGTGVGGLAPGAPGNIGPGAATVYPGFGGMLDSVWGNVGMTLNGILNNTLYGLMGIAGLIALIIGIRMLSQDSPVGSAIGALKKAV
jgi:hypothetical protein